MPIIIALSNGEWTRRDSCEGEKTCVPREGVQLWTGIEECVGYPRDQPTSARVVRTQRGETWRWWVVAIRWRTCNWPYTVTFRVLSHFSVHGCGVQPPSPDNCLQPVMSVHHSLSLSLLCSFSLIFFLFCFYYSTLSLFPLTISHSCLKLSLFFPVFTTCEKISSVVIFLF